MTDDQKFFEDLANLDEADPEPEAELAKASSISSKSPRILSRHEEEDFTNEPEGQLTIDVYQTGNDIIIESAIAGVRPEDIDIDVTSDSITIRGERRRDTHIKDEDYFYQECYWGRFSRSVILPQEVDPDSASVTFKNGVLTVRLPKVNRKKQRKLKVKLE
jgi:HSP20 family protein